MAKKLFKYDPPVKLQRGLRIKIDKGLYLRGGEAMLVEERLLKGVAYVYEVEPDGSRAGDEYSRPDADLSISIPEDEEGLEKLAKDLEEKDAVKGVKKTGKRTFKAGDKEAKKALTKSTSRPRKLSTKK